MKSLEELRVIRERMQGTVAYRSEHESLEEAALVHGIEPDLLVARINAFLDSLKK